MKLKTTLTKVCILGMFGTAVCTAARAQIYLSENFEGAFSGSPGAPTGWSQSRVVLIGDGIPEAINTNGERDWEVNNNFGAGWSLTPASNPVTPGAPVSGIRALWMQASSFGTANANLGSRRLSTPTINLSTATSPYVRFWYFQNTPSNALNLRVMASADGGATWNPIMIVAPNFTVPGGTTISSSTAWQQISVNVPAAYRTANAKVGIEVSGTSSTGNIFIDDFVVQEFSPTTITSAGSGLWTNPATWVGGVVPTVDNSVVISTGHTVSVDANIARCQNLQVNGTIQQNSNSQTELMQIFGNLTVQPGGAFKAINGFNGKRIYLGGNLVNNGSVDFSQNNSALFWVGGAPATYSGAGVITGNLIESIYHANSGGVTYNSSVRVTKNAALYIGAVTPNNRLTMGGTSSFDVLTIERARGSLSGAPIWGLGTRNMVYNDGSIGFIPCDPRTHTTGEEIQQTPSGRTVSGSLTMNTHGNVQLGYPLTVGNESSVSMSLQRGILISSTSNPLVIKSINFFSTLTTSPSTATPPTTHGSYIAGAVKLSAGAGSSIKTLPIGKGVAYNGSLPNANIVKPLVLNPGSIGWNGQIITASIESDATGTGPAIDTLFGSNMYRVQLSSGPELPATIVMTMNAQNYTHGGGENSDSLTGPLNEVAIVQSTSPTGPWVARSSVSGTGAPVNNTNYQRLTISGAISPLAAKGEYFTWANIKGCSGTPTAGTVSAPGSICSDVSFNLSLSGVTEGFMGLSYQWQSRTVGSGQWTNMSGSITPALITSITSTREFRAYVVCSYSGASDTSSSVTVNVNPFYTCYCGPSTTGTELHTSVDGYISNVSITGTTMNSSNTGLPSNGVTAVPMTPSSNTATLTGLTSYTITATLNGAPQAVAAWIDFDGDGSYFSSGEFNPMSITGNTASVTVDVPGDATWGLTGMRVRAVSSSQMFSYFCTKLSGGETEDYVITLAAPPQCSGMPVPGMAHASDTASCVGNSLSFSLTGSSAGVSDLLYQWQRSEPGQNNWSDIAGAETKTADIIIDGSFDYRAKLTCSVSSDVSFSTPVTVAVKNYMECYCTSDLYCDLDHATYFRFAGIDNESGACSGVGYSDFTALEPGSLSLGSVLPVSIAITEEAYEDYAGIWIDYNHNGSFDVSEFTLLGSAFAGDTISALLTVPADAMPGMTRLRLYIQAGSAISGQDGCPPSYVSGEIEDYLVNIVDPSFPQVDNLMLTDITKDAIKVTVDRSAGHKGVIVVAREGAPVENDPVNTIGYNMNTLASGATQWFTADSIHDALGGGKVVYKKNSTAAGTLSFTLKGLKTFTQYYFAAYAYDSTTDGIVYHALPATADATTLNAAPTIGATNLVISNVGQYGMNLAWTNGSGAQRIVVVKPMGTTDAPVDNIAYTANAVYGSGSQIGTTGSYVVYNGTGSSVAVTGLLGATKYYVSVIEYNGTGGNLMYTTKSLKGYTTTLEDFVSFKTSGIPMMENFNDSLVITGTSSRRPIGWHFLEGGPGANTTYTADNGATPLGNTYSYGTTGNADRAMGSYLNVAVNSKFAVKLTNKSSKDTVTSVLVRYTGEQWRRGGGVANAASAKDTLKVDYSVNATALGAASATWARVPALDFLSPAFGTAAALDGNAAANRTKKEASITGLSLKPGQSIWIRFTDADLAGQNDDGLAVDDMEIIPFTKTLSGNQTMMLTAVNDLNIISGTITVGGASLAVKNALNITSGASVNLVHATDKKGLTITSYLYGTGTINGGPLSSVTVGGPKVATATGYNQTLYFAPNSSLAGLTLKGNAYASLGSAVSITALPKAGVVKVGSFSAATSTTMPATLFTNGNLTLKSDTTGTATIGAVYGAITGMVNIERALQQRAGIRLLSHPFVSSVALSEVNDDVTLDISGGAGQNIWYYDQANANPNGLTDLATSAPWTGFGSLSARPWNAGEVIRLMKPQGAVTLDMVAGSGNVKQGNVMVNAMANASDSTVLIGNPYPAGVKMGMALATPISGGVMNGSAVWTWDPTKGTAGAFVAVPSIKIPSLTVPMSGAVVAMVTPGQTATLNFTESMKAGVGNTKTYFRADGEEEEVEVEEEQPEVVLNEGLQLVIEQNGHYFDGSYVYFDKDAGDVKERIDAPKLSNPNFNFYSLSSGAEKLSVDVRPFQTGKTISMGLVTTELGNYTVKVADYNLPEGTELYLVDRFRGTEELVTSATSYNFSIDSREGSQGSGRFSLRMGRTATIASVLTMELIPNPATDQVTIRVNGEQEGKAHVRVLSLTGQQMMATEIESVRHSQVSVPLNNLASGIYMVEVSAGGQKLVKQLVKQ